MLVHNGTPNTRHLFGPAAADAAARGLRLIGYDRPGYGGSTPQPGRTVADCAADVRAICTGLGMDRLAMWGVSGGGPHVLACAALLPHLVTAVASLASPAPVDAEGLDWFEGMGQGNADDIKLQLSDKVAARAKLETSDTPYTPAHTLIRALRVSLKKILAEGMENIWKRQARHAAAARAGFTALGLEIFAQPPNNALTVVKTPATIDASAVTWSGKVEASWRTGS